MKIPANSNGNPGGTALRAGAPVFEPGLWHRVLLTTEQRNRAIELGRGNISVGVAIALQSTKEPQK